MVAEKFEKEHRVVITAIRNIVYSSQNCEQFFVSTTYTDNSGKSNPMYIMNRDGFTLLVMGFTGKKALEFKLQYIEAFNKMEESHWAILHQRMQSQDIVKGRRFIA